MPAQQLPIGLDNPSSETERQVEEDACAQARAGETQNSLDRAEENPSVVNLKDILCIAAHSGLGLMSLMISSLVFYPMAWRTMTIQVQRKMVIYQQRLSSPFRILLRQKSGRLLKLTFLVTSGPIHQLPAGHYHRKRRQNRGIEKQKEETTQLNKTYGSIT
jgi:hypothetical protein